MAYLAGKRRFGGQPVFPVTELSTVSVVFVGNVLAISPETDIHHSSDYIFINKIFYIFILLKALFLKHNLNRFLGEMPINRFLHNWLHWTECKYLHVNGNWLTVMYVFMYTYMYTYALLFTNLGFVNFLCFWKKSLMLTMATLFDPKSRNIITI